MEKNYVIAAQAATLDKMDLTPDELLFALREFDAIWQRFEQTDPIQRAREAGVDYKVFSGAFAMLTHAFEQIYWKSDNDAREEVERKQGGGRLPEIG
jgi:hypothetical protein